jgi:glutaredoxin
MITIYGHQRCVWCTKAKQLAEQYQLSYDWKDTDVMENLNDLKQKFPNVKTVPQVWWDERHIGGYEQFSSEIENTLGNYGQDKF